MEINIIKNKLLNGLNLTIEESSKIFELIIVEPRVPLPPINKTLLPFVN